MAWPQLRDVPHWQSVARVARINAADAYAPSMRQKIDVQEQYAEALRAMPDMIDGQPLQPVRPTCAVTVEDMLSGV